MKPKRKFLNDEKTLMIHKAQDIIAPSCAKVLQHFDESGLDGAEYVNVLTNFVAVIAKSFCESVTADNDSMKRMCEEIRELITLYAEKKPDSVKHVHAKARSYQ